TDGLRRPVRNAHRVVGCDEDLRATQLELGEVEQIVDEMQQHVCRAVDLLHRVLLRLLELACLSLEKQIGVTEDRVQWSPELVAHVRHELVLQSLRLLCFADPPAKRSHLLTQRGVLAAELVERLHALRAGCKLIREELQEMQLLGMEFVWLLEVEAECANYAFT